jgi:hypothetical protein
MAEQWIPNVAAPAPSSEPQPAFVTVGEERPLRELLDNALAIKKRLDGPRDRVRHG